MAHVNATARVFCDYRHNSTMRGDGAVASYKLATARDH